MRLEALRPSMDPIAAVVSSVLEDADEGSTLEHRKMLAWTDGVLTAAAVGPERVPLAELARAVFDSDRDFDDPEFRQAATSLLGLMYKILLRKLKREGADYTPRFLEYAENGEEVPLAGEWAHGFLAGIRLRGEMWRGFINTDHGRRLLGPIVVFLSDKDGSSLVLKERLHEAAEIQADALEWLGHVVFKLSRHWKVPGRRSARADSDPFAKTGRNEPCPCGSGKKYKKCCLDEAA
jgi:uncharacterized protein